MVNQKIEFHADQPAKMATITWFRAQPKLWKSVEVHKKCQVRTPQSRDSWPSIVCNLP